MGFLWAALEPLLYFSVLYVVFTGIRAREESFAIYLISGVMLFHIFGRGTSGGITSLTGNSGIIKSLRIKKEIFPVITTVAIGLLAFVDVGVFFGLMPIFHFIPSFTIVLLPIILILLLILILGLSYILSIITVYARDAQIMWGIFVSALLFLSPIFWRVNDVNGILLHIHRINPLGQLIELTHILVIDGKIPTIHDWLYTAFYILGIFFLGYFIFNKTANTVTEKL